MEEKWLTDSEVRRALVDIEQRHELLKFAQDSGVSAPRLQSIINNNDSLSFDERFLINTAIGE